MPRGPPPSVDAFVYSYEIVLLCTLQSFLASCVQWRSRQRGGQGTVANVSTTAEERRGTSPPRVLPVPNGNRCGWQTSCSNANR